MKLILFYIFSLSFALGKVNCDEQIKLVCKEIKSEDCGNKLSLECDAFLKEKLSGNPIQVKMLEKFDSVCTTEFETICPNKKFEKLVPAENITAKRQCLREKADDLSAICQKMIRKFDNF